MVDASHILDDSGLFDQTLNKKCVVSIQQIYCSQSQIVVIKTHANEKKQTSKCNATGCCILL